MVDNAIIAGAGVDNIGYIFRAIALGVLTLLVATFILNENVYATSPSFVRQVIGDAENDGEPLMSSSYGDHITIPTKYNHYSVRFADNTTQCTLENNDEVSSADIKSVSYVGDGKILNGTIWLAQPLYSLPKDTFEESLRWLHVSILNVSSINNNLTSLASNTMTGLQTQFEIVETNNNTLIANRYPSFKIIYASKQDPFVGYGTFLTVKNNIGYAITYQAPRNQFDNSLQAMEKNIINSSTILDLFNTYQDGKSGISIEYPIDWDWSPGTDENFVSTLSSTYNKSINFFPVESTSSGDPSLSLTIEDLPSENIPIKDYVMEDIRYRAEIGYDSINSTIVDLAGNIPTYKIEYRYEDSGLEYNGLTVIMKNKDKIYYLDFQADKTRYQHYLASVQKMIESFEIPNLYQQSPMQNTEDDLTRINYLKDWEPEWGPEFVQVVNPINNLFSNMSIYNVSFRSPLTDASGAIPWQYISFSMLVSVDSAYSENSDYQYSINWNNTSLGWDKQFSEKGLGSTQYGIYKTLFEANNSTDFFSPGNNYVNLNLDLKYLNYPETYDVLFFTDNVYMKDGRICKFNDVSDWGTVPPPKFNMTATPSTLELRPGDEKVVTLSIKSNTAEKYFLNFSTGNTNSNLSATLPPGRSVPISGEVVASLKVNASEYAMQGTHRLPIFINAIFPSSANYLDFNKTVINPTNTTIFEDFPLTVTVLPALSPEQQWHNRLQSVADFLSPVNSIWTFVTAVGVVMVPVILRRISKKQDKKNDQKKMDGYYSGSE